MYDTIRLKSPYISEDIALKVESECIKRIGLDIKTQELIYEITTGSLEGSYDSRISIKVDRLEYKSVEYDKITELSMSSKKTPSLVSCMPYIEIEASVHKAMLGHNCFGGPIYFQKACAWLVKLVQDIIQVDLPLYEEWEVKRVDVAEVYELDSFEAVQEWFKGLNSCDYPRRQVNRYGLSGLYASGSTTALKFYHKGVEFIKHDRSRLKKLLDVVELHNIQDKALKIIRCECEIKARKLKGDFGFMPKVKDLTDDYLNNVHDLEVKRFLKEGVSMMVLVKNAHDVERRLFSLFDSRLAGILLGTWFKLTTLGEDSVKKSMSKPTYYRQIKQLKESGISWHGTDVVLKSNSLIPEGFVPIRDDSRRVVGEAEIVKNSYLSIA